MKNYKCPFRTTAVSRSRCSIFAIFVGQITMSIARSIFIVVTSLVVCADIGHATQSDELVPISPREEQGKRAVLIGYGAVGQEESLQQDEELPLPKSTPQVQNQLQLNESFDPGRDAKPDSLVGEPIRQRYPDGKIQILRYVRQDEFGNYYNDGPWKLFNRTGQIMAEGQFEDDAMHGTWSRWHPVNSDGIFRTPPFANQQGPFLSIASFNRGKLDGVWTIYDRSRRKIFEMQYVDGLRHGTATWWSNAGYLVREMQFQQGLIHGQAVEYDGTQKPVSQINYVQGRREFSQITWHRQNQKKSEDFYLDGKLELHGEDNWWDAKPAEYVRTGEPVRHGFARVWYENGQLASEGTYVEGARKGEFTWWHANGQQQLVGEFDHDKKIGQWTWWHDNGMKAVAGKYSDDTPVGVWTWWDVNGKVTRSGDIGSGEINLRKSTETESDAPNLNPPSVESFEEISPNEAPQTGDK